MAPVTPTISKAWPDKFRRTSSAPSFTTIEWWTHSLWLIEQTQNSENVWCLGSLNLCKKDSFFFLCTFCTGPWAQAPATETSCNRITQGTETLGRNRQGSPNQCCPFPWCTTLGTCIHSSSNYFRHSQHCTWQNIDTKVKEKCSALKEKDAVASPDQWTNNYNTQCGDFRKKTCEIMCIMFYFSEPQFLHLRNGNDHRKPILQGWWEAHKEFSTVHHLWPHVAELLMRTSFLICISCKILVYICSVALNLAKGDALSW